VEWWGGRRWGTALRSAFWKHSQIAAEVLTLSGLGEGGRQWYSMTLDHSQAAGEALMSAQLGIDRQM
jgi:hypothetical protein